MTFTLLKDFATIQLVCFFIFYILPLAITFLRMYFLKDSFSSELLGYLKNMWLGYRDLKISEKLYYLPFGFSIIYYAIPHVFFIKKDTPIYNGGFVLYFLALMELASLDPMFSLFFMIQFFYLLDCFMLLYMIEKTNFMNSFFHTHFLKAFKIEGTSFILFFFGNPSSMLKKKNVQILAGGVFVFIGDLANESHVRHTVKTEQKNDPLFAQQHPEVKANLTTRREEEVRVHSGWYIGKERVAGAFHAAGGMFGAKKAEIEDISSTTSSAAKPQNDNVSVVGRTPKGLSPKKRVVLLRR